jgi:hypothetical protein
MGKLQEVDVVTHRHHLQDVECMTVWHMNQMPNICRLRGHAPAVIIQQHLISIGKQRANDQEGKMWPNW